jgi:hypothetical protein
LNFQALSPRIVEEFIPAAACFSAFVLLSCRFIFLAKVFISETRLSFPKRGKGFNFPQKITIANQWVI